MVSKQDKKRSLEFIANQLLTFTDLTLVSSDPVSIRVNRSGSMVDFVLANFLPSADAFIPRYAQNKNEGVYTSPLLYKDGKTSFVRMVEHASWRSNKSLKNYAEQAINQMIALRKIEKVLLDFYVKKEIPYYQPPTARLHESIRIFKMFPVNLDYSHLSADDPGYSFAENRESIDYKLPKEVEKEKDLTLLLYQQILKAKLAKAA